MIYFSGSILDYCAVWCFSLLPYMGCIHISIYIYIYKIDMVSSQIGNVFCCQVHGSLSGTEERCCGQILPRAPFPRTVALCAGRMPRLALIGSITYICIVYTYIYNIYIYTQTLYIYVPALTAILVWEPPLMGTASEQPNHSACAVLDLNITEASVQTTAERGSHLSV